MEITKISAATFGGSGRGQLAEQGFALIYLSMLCYSLEIGSNPAVPAKFDRYKLSLFWAIFCFYIKFQKRNKMLLK
jgi:hypothetical protein